MEAEYAGTKSMAKASGPKLIVETSRQKTTVSEQGTTKINKSITILTT